MVIIRTSAVEVSIHAVSPLSSVGASPWARAAAGSPTARSAASAAAGTARSL